jgi:starch-binding outer membrane protein SusE/F
MRGIINPLKYITMKKNIILLFTFIGLIGLLFSCEKDETKVYMPTDPIIPEIVTFPDLTLEKANALDTLAFIGTPIDPGFTASANYFLEACAAGTNFPAGASTIRVYFGKQDTLITITEEALNKLFYKKFAPGTPAPIDFRIRTQLVIDAGTGSPGSSTNPVQYISEIYTETISTYNPL